MLDGTQNIIELMALRSDILNSGNAWADFSDQQSQDGMLRLAQIERAILEVPRVTDADKLSALSILLDANDNPGFADDFKNDLFASLRLGN